VFPTASWATAFNVCEPRAACEAFHVKLNGAAVAVAVSTPSTYTSTETTPTLSLELVVMLTVFDTIAPDDGDVIEIAGGVTSVPLLTFTVTLAVLEPPLPSRAVALTEWLPLV
jgi:hypothetical protein